MKLMTPIPKQIVLASVLVFSLVTLSGIAQTQIFAEESEGYKMIGDITPVLTFTFRDGVETYEFPVFKMGENFADNSGVSFSVEGYRSFDIISKCKSRCTIICKRTVR